MDYNLILQKKDPIDESFFIYSKDDNIFWGDTLEEIKEKTKTFYEDENLLPKVDGVKVDKVIFFEEIDSLEEKDLKKIEIKILKPDYSTNLSILDNAIKTDENGVPKIDFIKYNQYRILLLLNDWNIEQNNKKSAINATTLGYLHPIIIEAFINKINKNVAHYFGILNA